VPQAQAAAASQQAASALLQPLLDALLADQHAGLLRLLQAMHSGSKVICVLMATGICIFAQAVHNRLGTAQGGAALAHAMLARQQQGLSLVLQALHDDLYPDAASNVLRCLAHAAPVRLLDALLSQQQRRGMQSLLRCLDAASEHASECTDCFAAAATVAYSAAGPAAQQCRSLLQTSQASQHTEQASHSSCG
jgi:hypothetical protein